MIEIYAVLQTRKRNLYWFDLFPSKQLHSRWKACHPRTPALPHQIYTQTIHLMSIQSTHASAMQDASISNPLWCENEKRSLYRVFPLCMRWTLDQLNNERATPPQPRSLFPSTYTHTTPIPLFHNQSLWLVITARHRHHEPSEWSLGLDSNVHKIPR